MNEIENIIRLRLCKTELCRVVMQKWFFMATRLNKSEGE